MDRTIQFNIPQGISAEQLAKRFTALLKEVRGSVGIGPWRMQESSDRSWQLDDTNDYWLHIHEDGAASIRCRYDDEYQFIIKATNLFHAQPVQ